MNLKACKNIPMQLSWKIFSTISGKAIMLEIDGRKFSFGMFEGYQRYCIEDGFKMYGLDHIFLSSLDDLPGFIGSYLTFEDTGKKNISLISKYEIPWTEIHNFCKKSSYKISTGSNYVSKKLSVDLITVNEISSFFIKFSPIRGKFHPELVPESVPKPLYKKLADGETVFFDGKSYKGSDFLDQPALLGNTLLLFGHRLNSELIERFKESSLVISSNIKILEELNEHISLNRNVKIYYIKDAEFTDYERFFRYQVGQNQMNQNYIIPYIEDNVDLSRLYKNKDTEPIIEKKKILKNDCDLDRSKNIDCDTLNFCMLHSRDVLKYKKGDYLIIKEKNDLSENFKNSEKIVYDNKEKLIFLGTSCAQPSKLRNVSSIALELDDYIMLFDCGEDTVGQIIRYCHSQRAFEDFIGKIKYIYISHSHADHLLGLYRLTKYLNHKVYIIGPHNVEMYLKGLFKSETNLIEFVFTNNAKKLEKSFYSRNEYFRCREYIRNTKKDNIFHGLNELKYDKYSEEIVLEDIKCSIVGVEHSSDSTSVSVVDKKTNLKISYSGDTSPSILFSIIGRHSDILIHESTFLEEDMERAIRTRHSTMLDAEKIFELSESKTLFLTHFSNRIDDKQDIKNGTRDLYIHYIKK